MAEDRDRNMIWSRRIGQADDTNLFCNLSEKVRGSFVSTAPGFGGWLLNFIITNDLKLSGRYQHREVQQTSVLMYESLSLVDL